MDIGYFAAHEQYGPNTLVAHVERAERAGFDTVWTSDHVHPWWHTDAHCGAALPWMGAALERTDDVRIGTGVTPPIARYHGAPCREGLHHRQAEGFDIGWCEECHRAPQQLLDLVW